ncbi:MAG: hypothetical protein NTX75_14720 [Proteobacteria bacterium]|nr:hypothetical protein [Pseudomonadota bacterium]
METYPHSPSFAMVKALIGQLYPAILMARLVSLGLEEKRRGKTSSGDMAIFRRIN